MQLAIPRRVAFVVALACAVAAVGCSSGGGGSTNAFCTSVRSGENPLDVFDRYDPSSVSTARDQLQRGVDRLRELERAAPAEVRGDMQVLVAVGDKLLAALDPASVGKQTPDFSSDFQRVQDASGAVTRFASERCGIDLTVASSAPNVTGATTPSSTAN